jgi:hypothetical protein
MSELWGFLGLGFHHITDAAALDHLLFLFALAAVYRWGDLGNLVRVITAFTIGHSLTLALAVTGALVLPASLIEFLIPLTIIAAGAENLVRSRIAAPRHGRWRPIYAGVFGLVHGAGFATYLQSLFTGSIVVPLVGFNLGIELGQIAVLAVAGLVLLTMDRLVGLRLRVTAVSATVVILAARMAVERVPW